MRPPTTPQQNTKHKTKHKIQRRPGVITPLQRDHACQAMSNKLAVMQVHSTHTRQPVVKSSCQHQRRAKANVTGRTAIHQQQKQGPPGEENHQPGRLQPSMWIADQVAPNLGGGRQRQATCLGARLHCCTSQHPVHCLLVARLTGGYKMLDRLTTASSVRCSAAYLRRHCCSRCVSAKASIAATASRSRVRMKPKGYPRPHMIDCIVLHRACGVL